MIRNFIKKIGPVVPIIYIDANINQARTAYLLKKLRRYRYDYAQGLAIVCSVQNCMPVQVDKIYQQISRIKQQYSIPVYGFLVDECTAQSYYMTTIADEVYSLPSTVFKLQHNQTKLSWQSLLEKYKIKKIRMVSSGHLSGGNFDKFTSANTLHIGNKKYSHINERIYEESIYKRKKILAKRPDNFVQLSDKLPRQIPNCLIGQEAIRLGLVDKLGEHYDILRQKYPGCYLEVIKYMQQPKSIKRSLAILTSPILLFLFILKVIIKWTLIMYVWLKSKNNGKDKTIQEAQKEVEERQ